MKPSNKRSVTFKNEFTKLGSFRSKKIIFCLLSENGRERQREIEFLKSFTRGRGLPWGKTKLENGPDIAWGVAPDQQSYYGLKQVIFDESSGLFFLIFHKCTLENTQPSQLEIFLENINRKERRLLKGLGAKNLKFTHPLQADELICGFHVAKLEARH